MGKQAKVYFVAGTDTGVGKSITAAAILHGANERGLKTMGLKPIAAGCEATEHGLRNDDALLLQRYSSIELPYDVINPVALKLAIAPHLAAEHEGRSLNLARLEGLCRGALMHRPDLALVEGAGGWRVPINARHTLAHLAQVLDLPVILVIGLKLGCINHALLTVEAIRADGLTVAGWVINQVDPHMDYAQENIASIAQRIAAPCLGVIPYLGDAASVEDAAAHIDLTGLL
jgi:dethiobiotin synthetase